MRTNSGKLLPFLLIILIFSSFAPPKRTNIILKKGSKITYTIDAKGQTYEMVVTIKKLSPDIIFSYETRQPSPLKGTITVTKDDLDSARTLYNVFDGTSAKLENQISLFVSQTIYAELAMAGMNDFGTTFMANPGESMDTFSRGEPAKIPYVVNGNTIPVDVEKFYDHVDSKSGNYHYSFIILKNETFPLIVEMEMGWKLKLKKIENVSVTKTDEY